MYFTIKFSDFSFSRRYLIITFSFSFFSIAENRRLIRFWYSNILGKLWWNLTKLTACLVFIIVCGYLIKLVNFIIKNLIILFFIELSLKIKLCFATSTFFSSWISCCVQHSWKFTKLLKSKFIIDCRGINNLFCFIILIFSPKFSITSSIFLRIFRWTTNLFLLFNNLICLFYFRLESMITFSFQLFNAWIVRYTPTFVWNWLANWLKYLTCFQGLCQFEAYARLLDVWFFIAFTLLIF